MKKLITEYRATEKNLKHHESEREQLLSEQLTFHAKLIEARKLLHDTEIEQIQFLRRSLTQRQIGEAIGRFETAEAGERANVCAPGTIEDDLNAFHTEIDGQLETIYGKSAVKKMRESVMQVKASVENLQNAIKKVDRELESIDAKIISLKSDLFEQDKQICIKAFEDVKADIEKSAWPIIRKAFVSVNLFNPYFLKWPDARFFTLLFGNIKFSADDLLSERDKIRNTIFKNQ